VYRSDWFITLMIISAGMLLLLIIVFMYRRWKRRQRSNFKGTCHPLIEWKKDLVINESAIHLITYNSGARFSIVPKLFGWQKSLCIFNKCMFQALKVGSYFAFPYNWNILKEQLFTSSWSQFQELLFEPDKLPDLSRNVLIDMFEKWWFRVRGAMKTKN